MMTSIVWLRNDLRLHDNPALVEASKTGHPVLLLYILSTDPSDPFPLGTASKVWLHYSLMEFCKSIEPLGLTCTIRQGEPLTVLKEVVRESGAKALFWNRPNEPHLQKRDRQISDALASLDIEVKTCAGNSLFEPGHVTTKEGKPFQVFTPFWNYCLKAQDMIAKPLSIPAQITPFRGHLSSFSIELVDSSFTRPIVGERAALGFLERFSLSSYEKRRDIPSVDGTSKLSAYLHFGQISARQVWHMCQQVPLHAPFLRQIGWREFAIHLLHAYPESPWKPLRQQFERFVWRDAPEELEAWKRGMTGYPIVDAGMRQLLHTGWMHNRLRMIVGSFLVKHLLISWVEGEKWFWERLFDADLANNVFGWQWIGGCGADAAPYFRIFNPVLQGEKYDAEGTFVKQWVPELEHVPAKYIHTPWKAPQGTLQMDYPSPIVGLEEGRARALQAYKKVLKHLVAVATCLCMASCTRVPQADDRQVVEIVQERIAKRVHWNQGGAEDAQVCSSIEQLLTADLQLDAAVQIALLNNPQMQANFEELGIAQADLVQAGLFQNPIFAGIVRFPVKNASSINTDFSITQSFLELFLIPLRKKVAVTELEQTQLRVANRVLALAFDVRETYYRLQAEQTAFGLLQLL
ncbi:MAG: deoxyribodipyrimidine photo-lyase, partial [Verrucomicrobia bacterium]|nr:deoxyribodipyrimidine photo-lyase [Verrucomicrobiota bacterium]